jgi:DNA-binding sugar fermentation-stimulating protein
VEVKPVNLVEDGAELLADAHTERGARQIGELAASVRDDNQTASAFIVQRDDATALAHFYLADPVFVNPLLQMVSVGVGAYAIDCETTPAGQTTVLQVPVLLEQPATAGQGRSL